MESKVKVLGHPLHPILIVFPLGLLITAVLFDVIYLITGNVGFASAAFWNITAGIIFGVASAVPGALDWLAIPTETRARKIGLIHAIGNDAMLILFAISWWLRFNNPDYAAGAVAFVLAVLAIALGGPASWFGGELVMRMGIGVEPGAHPNASSSLSGEPAQK